MSWSEVVHENRKRAELQRAREELRLRRRGYAVEEKPSAGIPAVLSLAGALTAAAWWRREGRKPHSRDWKNLPGISQLLDFLQSDGKGAKRAPTRSKSKPKSQLAAPSKAAAARQAAGRPAAAGPPRAGSGGGGGSGGAAAAAGAAALMRAEQSRSGSGGGGSGSAAQREQQPEASTSYSSSTQPQQTQSKPKKKKNKKKK